MTLIKSMSSFTILLVVLIVQCQSEAVKDLCDDPYIHAADRLSNNTYRVYRDNYYWELVGLPDRVAKVNGPYKIWLKNMAPLTRGSPVFTVVGGNIDGQIFKYKGERFWNWNKNGIQRSGEDKGWKWSGFPTGGFSAAYSDGDLNKKGYPMLIAFSGIKVYYFNTNDQIFRRIGEEGGANNGAFQENFPPDLTAAMPFKTGDPNYHIYLFKQTKYCYRTITEVDAEGGCEEWRQNKELFGCLKADNSKTDVKEPEKPEPEKPEPEKPEVQGQPETPDKGDRNDRGSANKPEGGHESKPLSMGFNLLPNQNFVLLLFAIIFVKNFF